MLEQVQWTVRSKLCGILSKQESVLQKQDRCKQIKSSYSLMWEESALLFQNKTQGCGQITRTSFCVTEITWTISRITSMCGTSQEGWDNRYKTFPLIETVKQTGYLLMNLPVKLGFITFSVGVLPKTLRAHVYVFYFYVSISGWCGLDCRHPTSSRCCQTSSVQQVLSFSLPLPSPPALPKLEREYLDGTIAALPMK